VDAPVGEWRFGNLRWWSFNQPLGYRIKSPIAVRASLFDAPAEISARGEVGSVDVEVLFGYSGAYTAAGHGLQPAVVSFDSVDQDPDQTFDPNDGYSDSHRFELSGAAFLRVALPPEATEADADLDIFVMDPDGNIVAASTKGGTDEVVDIANPADGVWTVYVHGWAAPGGDSDYDLYSWVLSATPGGKLTIPSAPGSAVMGASGTVTAGWEDAALGEWHLGAISHTGASGVMGLTLVEVDNR
jgi:hypothetical protein